MQLHEILEFADVAIRRDGEFRNLGFLFQNWDEMLSFVEEERFLGSLQRSTGVTAVLTTPELAESIPMQLALAVTERPRLAFARVHNHLAQTGFYWRDFPSEIDPSAAIDPAASVAAKNVRIGRGATISAHAVIQERCIVGGDVSIGAGSVLGAVGFQTVHAGETVVEMRHAGALVIGERAHVLPGAVVATALFGNETKIGRDARIGSQAFVSHAVEIGERTIVGHGAVVNGNVKVGKDVWIGPGAIIANNLEIGEGAFITLGAVVIRNIAAGMRVSGNFAGSHRQRLKALIGSN